MKLKQAFFPKREVGDIKHFSNIILLIIFAIFSIACILPFIFTVIISLTDENSLSMYGYRFIPSGWSIEAYRYIFSIGTQILRSYGVSIIVTAMATFLNLFLTSFYAYVLAQNDFKYKRFLSIFALITMLFGAGLVPSYIINTRVLFLKNTIWALVLPGALGAWNIFVMRTYFQRNIPRELMEAARIDGAGEFRIFFTIVIPLSKPILAVIAFFTIVANWNAWMGAMLYIDDPKLVPIMRMLMMLQNNMEFLVKNAHLAGASTLDIMQNMPTEAARMAVVVLVVIPIALVYPFVQKYFVKGLIIGSIKG